MTPAFTDPAARRRWDAYFSEVDRLLARADADVAEMRGDLEAHVVDSMAAASGGNERERLDAALSRLGRPIDYLRPLLADELIERGTLTYSPITIARGLSHSVMAGSRRAVIGLAFGLGYLLLAIFTAWRCSSRSGVSMSVCSAMRTVRSALASSRNPMAPANCLDGGRSPSRCCWRHCSMSRSPRDFGLSDSDAETLPENLA